MKVEVFNAHNKYMILKHALKENNVSLKIVKHVQTVAVRTGSY